LTRNKNMVKKDNNLKKNKTGWREVDVLELERMRQPGYRYISKGLTWDATPTDKAKYEIQQNILRYTRENNISDQILKKKLGIKQEKLDYLLFAHLEHFNLDELVSYATELFAPFELKIVRPGEEVHMVSQPKANDRTRKHA